MTNGNSKNEIEMTETLRNLFESVIDATEMEDQDELADAMTDLVDDVGPIGFVADFSEVGILTGNSGIVLRLENGAEYQITVVQSRPARDE